jgi:hypothetical protein
MWSKKDMLDYSEKVGHQIGLYCGDVEQKAALYDLRRCKRYWVAPNFSTTYDETDPACS